eukprot:c8479_g1_i1.p1 GENE.c8479_g1_i1~~c8479_g1_i1.p1  ORF type:complete len:267 (+),score=70.47 c8479_g1_i1:149-949(+)
MLLSTISRRAATTAAFSRVPLITAICRGFTTTIANDDDVLTSSSSSLSSPLASLSIKFDDSLTCIKTTASPERVFALRQSKRGKLANEPQFNVDRQNFGVKLTLDEAVDILESEQMEELEVIPTQGRFEHCSYIIVCSTPRSAMHLRRVARVFNKKLQIRGLVQDSMNCVDGLKSGNWIVVDTGDMMIHLLTPQAREELDLETQFKTTFIPSPSTQLNELVLLASKDLHGLRKDPAAQKFVMRHLRDIHLDPKRLARAAKKNNEAR